MLINNSPVSQFQFNQRTIYVKRDDLLDPNFSGNKARKLAYFLTQPSADIDTLISYGGNQSNLMYSLSCLAKLKNWQFIYYTNQISSQAQLNAAGNLAASLANGMQIIPTKTKLNLLAQDLATNLASNQLLIQQGGAQSEAEFGIQQLAAEIRQWAAQQNFAQLAIFLIFSAFTFFDRLKIGLALDRRSIVCGFRFRFICGRLGLGRFRRLCRFIVGACRFVRWCFFVCGNFDDWL